MKIVRFIVNNIMLILSNNIFTSNKTGLRFWGSLKCDKKSSINTGIISVRKGTHLEAKNGGNICIGNNVNFNYNDIVVSHKKISIGNYVSIGPNVLIYDHDHNYKSDNWRNNFKCSDVIIGNNVWIGANVIILKGTIIEDNCVIAAGTILKGEHIKANTLVFNDLNLKTKKIERKS